MITFTNSKSKDIRSIRQSDPGFMIDDGMVRYPRAMLHILPECPSYVRDIIQTATAQGWIKPVAHVYGKELTMDALRG